MRTPKFWNKRGILAVLLRPLGSVYGFVTKLRLKYTPAKQISRPVVCIGNLTAGGTGKTPVAIAVAKILQNNFYHPFFVSRGYGGKLKDVVVTENKYSAIQAGDEPLLLSRCAPVVINPNRYLAALKAVENGADVVVMDDGFQNPKLYKDLSFIVFDGAYGWGNKLCIPAGPLRERWYRGIRRADAVVILGEDKHNIARKMRERPIFYGKVVPVNPKTKNKKVVAFAGIGIPDKFYNSLKELGYDTVATFDFPDHHYYTVKEIKGIIEKAQKMGADIFTTSKDYVKIPAVFKKEIKVLEIAINWENEELLTQFILHKLQS